MNRQTIVERVLCVLVPLLGFALVYGLPMLGLRVAIDHGWYVASAAPTVPYLFNRPRLTAFDVLDRLGPEQVTEQEFLDHCGLMIDEIERAALDSGRLREQWRTVPLWTDADVGRIRRGVLAEHVELAELEVHDDTHTGDDETTVKTVTAVDVSTNLRLTLDWLKPDNGPAYELAFGTPGGCDDFPTIDPADIPTLIDVLGDLYRTYHARLDREDKPA